MMIKKFEDFINEAKKTMYADDLISAVKEKYGNKPTLSNFVVFVDQNWKEVTGQGKAGKNAERGWDTNILKALEWFGFDSGDFDQKWGEYQE